LDNVEYQIAPGADVSARSARVCAAPDLQAAAIFSLAPVAP